MSTDAYSAATAAKVLGRSERLVRKLAAEGRLEIVATAPLRLSQESVHAERARRRSPTPKPAPDSPSGLSAEQIELLITRAVAAAVAEILPLMLESRDNAEARLAAELAHAQQQIEALRRDLDDERSKPALRLPLPPIGWPFRR